MNEKATAGNGIQRTVENLKFPEKRVEENLAVPPTHAPVVEDKVGVSTTPTNGVGTVRAESNGISRRTGGGGDQRDAETLHIDQRFFGHLASSRFLSRPNTAFSASSASLMLLVAVVFGTPSTAIFHERR